MVGIPVKYILRLFICKWFFRSFVSEWFASNKLKLNHEKCKYVSFGRRNDLDKLELLSLSRIPVELNRVRHMCMGGLLVDKCFTWAVNVNHVKNKCYTS